MDTSYDRDYAAWAEETAKLLREGRLQEVDVDHLAEEIEDMGKSQRHQLRSRVTQIMEHMLKLMLTSGAIHLANERGWRGLNRRQQGEIADLLRESPSLSNQLTEEMLQRCYLAAASTVSIEYGVSPPSTCPFTWVDLL